MLTAPVVITSQTHQPVGGSAYPVHAAVPGVPQMPMPYTDSSQPPYPMPSAGAPYPISGNAGPYPPAGATFPMSGNTAPYPPAGAYPPSNPTSGPPYPYSTQQQATMDPPAYNEVVSNSSYQKQAPFNPNFKQ